MGGQRLAGGQEGQIVIRSAVPKNKGQHTHQRTVPVSAFLDWARSVGRHALHQAVDRRAGLGAHVEHRVVYGKESLMHPSGQPVCKVLQIEPAFRQQAIKQDQRLGTVITPCTGRHPNMGTPESQRRGHLDLVGRWQITRRVELVGNAEGIAYQQADQPPGDAVLLSYEGHFQGVASLQGIDSLEPWSLMSRDNLNSELAIGYSGGYGWREFVSTFETSLVQDEGVGFSDARIAGLRGNFQGDP